MSSLHSANDDNALAFSLLGIATQCFVDRLFLFYFYIFSRKIAKMEEIEKKEKKLSFHLKFFSVFMSGILFLWPLNNLIKPFQPLI